MSALAIILASLYQPLEAQVGMAQLNGTVTDPSGAPIPNASVDLQGTNEKPSRRTTTGSSGEYAIPAINPGQYQLRIEVKGFETQTLTNILPAPGQASTLNVSMKLGQAVTSVNVQAVSPLLQTATATVGSDVTPQQLTSLPLQGRNFTTLITVLPGAGSLYDPHNNTETSVRSTVINPSVYGLRQRENDFTLDGVYNLRLTVTKENFLLELRSFREKYAMGSMITCGKSSDVTKLSVATDVRLLFCVGSGGTNALRVVTARSNVSPRARPE